MADNNEIKDDPEISLALEEASKILAGQAIVDWANPYQRSAVSRLIIILSECLDRSEKLNNLVCELRAKGIDPVGDGSLKDLLRRGRNMSAHIFSELRKLNGPYLDFNVTNHHAKGAFVIDGKPINFGFDDDYTLMWGGLQITIGGDICAAYEWLRMRYAAGLPSYSLTKKPAA